MDLLDYFGEQIELVQPEIVSMENVPQLRKDPVFEKFTTLLERNGYYVSWEIVYAPDYGVPKIERDCCYWRLNWVRLI